MKNLPPPTKKKPKGKDVRTTVSLAPVVWEWAKELMEAKGFNNFSAYVADLIRRDKERLAERSPSTAYMIKSEESRLNELRKEPPPPPKPGADP